MRLNYLEKLQHHLVMNAATTEDVLKLKKLLLLTAEYSAPSDAEALRQEINTMFQNPEEVLNSLKMKQQEK